MVISVSRVARGLLCFNVNVYIFMWFIIRPKYVSIYKSRYFCIYIQIKWFYKEFTIKSLSFTPHSRAYLCVVLMEDCHNWSYITTDNHIVLFTYKPINDQ